MNANGLARAYMARSMKVENFLAYVLECVEKELEEWGYQAETIPTWDQNRENCVVVFRINQTIFSLRVKRTLIEGFQKKGPYTLDRLFWQRLQEEGIELQNDRYIGAVFV